ncbi:hypothetical protein WME95_46640 [Sorangium sp. So ce327]|uniref:hypothetical protein n=1 Tax=Sorangium sp. So ce327 TaxID=3133301 RepID=UPI003F60B50E
MTTGTLLLALAACGDDEVDFGAGGAGGEAGGGTSTSTTAGTGGSTTSGTGGEGGAGGAPGTGGEGGAGGAPGTGGEGGAGGAPGTGGEGGAGGAPGTGGEGGAGGTGGEGGAGGAPGTGGEGGAGGAPGTGGEGGAGGAPGTGGAGGEGGAGDEPVRWADVEPILLAKCSPCHTRTDPAPASGFAITYESSQLASNSTQCAVDPGQPARTQGECATIRIHDLDNATRMPRNRGCTGDPALDVANSACLTAAQQQTLVDWIADGQLD